MGKNMLESNKKKKQKKKLLIDGKNHITKKNENMCVHRPWLKIETNFSCQSKSLLETQNKK